MANGRIQIFAVERINQDAVAIMEGVVANFGAVAPQIFVYAKEADGELDVGKGLADSPLLRAQERIASPA
jgi:hypothetical protein